MRRRRNPDLIEERARLLGSIEDGHGGALAGEMIRRKRLEELKTSMGKVRLDVDIHASRAGPAAGRDSRRHFGLGRALCSEVSRAQHSRHCWMRTSGLAAPVASRSVRSVSPDRTPASSRALGAARALPSQETWRGSTNGSACRGCRERFGSRSDHSGDLRGARRGDLVPGHGLRSHGRLKS